MFRFPKKEITEVSVIFKNTLTQRKVFSKHLEAYRNYGNYRFFRSDRAFGSITSKISVIFFFESLNNADFYSFHRIFFFKPMVFSKFLRRLERERERQGNFIMTEVVTGQKKKKN